MRQQSIDVAERMRRNADDLMALLADLDGGRHDHQ